MLKKLILVTLLFLLASCSNHIAKNHILTPEPQNSLRVASYNVNWENGAHSLKNPQLNIQAIIKTNADILVLQEATPKWIQRIKANKILLSRYPYILFRDHENAGGLAILSKYPITTSYYGHPKIGWHPIWIFRVNTSEGILQMVNIHLNPQVVTEGHVGFLARAVFSSRHIRRNEAKFILAHLNKKLPTILIGDFNEGNIGTAVKFFESHGFTDAINQTDCEFYTWEWREGLFNFFDRFDRVLFNKPITLLKFQVLHDGESDHYPIVADLQILKNSEN